MYSMTSLSLSSLLYAFGPSVGNTTSTASPTACLDGLPFLVFAPRLNPDETCKSYPFFFNKAINPDTAGSTPDKLVPPLAVVILAPNSAFFNLPPYLAVPISSSVSLMAVCTAAPLAMYLARSTFCICTPSNVFISLFIFN